MFRWILMRRNVLRDLFQAALVGRCGHRLHQLTISEHHPEVRAQGLSAHHLGHHLRHRRARDFKFMTSADR